MKVRYKGRKGETWGYREWFKNFHIDPHYLFLVTGKTETSWKCVTPPSGNNWGRLSRAPDYVYLDFTDFEIVEESINLEDYL